MPWTVADVESKKKGLTPAQKKKWVSIANGILKDCQAKGGKDCEGKAIRIANSKFEEIKMEKKTVKIPIGAMRLDSTESHAHVEFVGLAEGEEKKPKLNMVAYSGKIIKNHWWWDDLALDLTGFIFSKSKYPILESHDRSKKIAFTGKPKVTDDFKLVIDSENSVFVDTKESKEFQTLSSQGFPYESSVYVTPTVVERLEKDAEAQVNGYTMKGPGTIFRKMIFNEASVCVFGYDRHTKASTFSKEEEVELELEEGRISLSQEELEITNKGKEVNELKIETIEQLTKEYPELVQQIQTALKAEMETKFSEEKKVLEQKIAAKDVELSDSAARILKLEKTDSIRTEKERQSVANGIWNNQLAASNIPEHLFGKVKTQVSYVRFVKDEVFDETAFTAAVDAEIKDWESKGIVSSVMGTGFSGKTPDGKAAGDDKLEKEIDDTAEDLLTLAGEPPKDK